MPESQLFVQLCLSYISELYPPVRHHSVYETLSAQLHEVRLSDALIPQTGSGTPPNHLNSVPESSQVYSIKTAEIRPLISFL